MGREENFRQGYRPDPVIRPLKGFPVPLWETRWEPPLETPGKPRTRETEASQILIHIAVPVLPACFFDAGDFALIR